MTLQELFNQIHAGETVVVQLDLTAYHTLRVALLKKNSKQAKLMDAIGAPGANDFYIQCSYDKATQQATFKLVSILEKLRVPKQYKCQLI